MKADLFIRVFSPVKGKQKTLSGIYVQNSADNKCSIILRSKIKEEKNVLEKVT